MESFCPSFKTLNCHLPLSNGSAAISSHTTRLLKFIMLHQPNFLQLATNDLPSILCHSSPQCHVDDTKVILNFNLQDHLNAITKLNEDLCRISNWTFRNQLLINLSNNYLWHQSDGQQSRGFSSQFVRKRNYTGYRC